jgi:hypothetical protein
MAIPSAPPNSVLVSDSAAAIPALTRCEPDDHVGGHREHGREPQRQNNVGEHNDRRPVRSSNLRQHDKAYSRRSGVAATFARRNLAPNSMWPTSALQIIKSHPPRARRNARDNRPV